MDWSEIRTKEWGETVLNILKRRMDGWIGGLQQDATKYIDELGVLTREAVHQYYLPLWLWHRLDGDRRKASDIPLKESKRGSPSLDVDHVVSVKFWETLAKSPKPESEEQSGAPQSDELSSKVNALGNCCLLEKTFNIAKSSEPLREFLERVHEFNTGQTKIEEWARNVGFDNNLLDATGKTVADVSISVDDRTMVMKNDLKEYIMGARQRADLSEP